MFKWLKDLLGRGGEEAPQRQAERQDKQFSDWDATKQRVEDTEKRAEKVLSAAATRRRLRLLEEAESYRREHS